jgi:FMN phosphatase YigB (HAD superfamily)
MEVDSVKRPGDQSAKREVSVLITDLDNTLWDWFEIWYSSFRPFLDELVHVTGIPENILKPQIKAIHEEHHTAEYSRVLQELPCLQEEFGPSFDPREKLPTVVGAYAKGRKSASRLYDGVKETLDYINQTGAKTVGFTESQSFYTIQRIRTLELDGHLELLYSTVDRRTLTSDELKQMRKNPDEYYKLRRTEARILPTNSKKPDAALLELILSNLGVNKSSVIYVGDDLHKDVSMANAAGITSVYAAYGESHKDERYGLLVDVTHWPKEDVQSQKDATGEGVRPDYVLKRSFRELLDKFVFVPF